MDRHQIRKMIFKNRSTIKELMLTEPQERIVRLVRDRGSITSNWFSKYQKISVQNASMQLIKLFLKGYLTKTETVSETGGFINVYQSAL